MICDLGEKTCKGKQNDGMMIRLFIWIRLVNNGCVQNYMRYQIGLTHRYQHED